MLSKNQEILDFSKKQSVWITIQKKILNKSEFIEFESKQNSI